LNTLLNIDCVSKRFGGMVVVDQLSFAVAKGEALGIIGPNGAGKSTIFNLITGDVPIDTGTIAFNGTDVSRSPPYSRCHAGIGRTYQIPQPFGQMSVFENLLVGATFSGRHGDASIYDHCVRVLKATDLLSKANAPAGSLTLLQRKRLELARALATQPQLLLLDEIAGGLTEPECQELLDTIRHVHAQGIAIVWIEHIVHALVSFAKRVMVINAGRKLDDGPSESVLANPVVKDVYLGLPAS
jgi:branched-chain amino acid transport system ATP-binding protein